MRHKSHSAWVPFGCLLALLCAAACSQSTDLTALGFERDARWEDGSTHNPAEEKAREGDRDPDGGNGGDSHPGGKDPSELASLPDIVADPADDAAYLYDQNELRTYALSIPQEGLAIIDSDPRAEEYVPATLRFEGQSYDVLVRYKGSVGAFRGCVGDGGFNATGPKACTKLSMKVAFDGVDPEARFFGLRKLQFHAMLRDPSMLRERLGYAVFRAFGLPAPRAVHARLVINGELNGLFALVEQIDGRFTRSRFEEGGEGNLYKEAWPIDPMRVASSEQYLLSRLETNEDDSPTFEAMRGLGQALENASFGELPGVLERYFDPDALVRYIAADRTLAHDDGPFHFYCGGQGACRNHNYYLYEQADHQRLWLLAWDFDSVFNLDNPITTLAFAWDDPAIGCMPEVRPPGTLPVSSPLCDKLWLGAAQRQEPYLKAVRELLDGPLEESRVEAQLTRWEAQIESAVMEASALHDDAVTPNDWQAARDALRSAIAVLRQRAQDRLDLGITEIRDPQ